MRVPLAHAALRAFRAGRTVPADQAAPEYVRDKVAQTTAERVAEKAEKAEKAATGRDTAPRRGRATAIATPRTHGEGRQ